MYVPTFPSPSPTPSQSSSSPKVSHYTPPVYFTPPPHTLHSPLVLTPSQSVHLSISSISPILPPQAFRPLPSFPSHSYFILPSLHSPHTPHTSSPPPSPPSPYVPLSVGLTHTPPPRSTPPLHSHVSHRSLFHSSHLFPHLLTRPGTPGPPGLVSSSTSSPDPPYLSPPIRTLRNCQTENRDRCMGRRRRGWFGPE